MLVSSRSAGSALGPLIRTTATPAGSAPLERAKMVLGEMVIQMNLSSDTWNGKRPTRMPGVQRMNPANV
ncbi:MAG: hypothetical protein ACK4N1_08460 [Pseudorhizobium sp.]